MSANLLSKLFKLLKLYKLDSSLDESLDESGRFQRRRVRMNGPSEGGRVGILGVSPRLLRAWMLRRRASSSSASSRKRSGLCSAMRRSPSRAVSSLNLRLRSSLRAKPPDFGRYFSLRGLSLGSPRRGPLSPRLPRYRETYVITLVDKFCAVAEVMTHFFSAGFRRFRLAETFALVMLIRMTLH